MTSPNTLWTSEAAEQQAFSDLCRGYDLLGENAAFLGADCAGTTTSQIDATHAEITRTATTWFDTHLKTAYD